MERKTEEMEPAVIMGVVMVVEVVGKLLVSSEELAVTEELLGEEQAVAQEH